MSSSCLPADPFSTCPFPSILRISHYFSTSPSNLATLSLPTSNSTLYSALLQYAALSPPRSSKKFNPLCLPEDYDTFPPIGNLKMFEVFPDEQFHLDLGEGVIVWPPPSHLKASTLQGKQKIRLGYSSVNPEDVEVNDPIFQNGTLSSVASDDEDNKDESGEQGGEVNNDANEDGANAIHADAVDGNGDDNERPNTCNAAPPVAGSEATKSFEFYFVHYEVSNSSADSGRRGSSKQRAILLATPEGPSVLQWFCAELHEWYHDKKYSPPVQGFSLQRYMSEEGGHGYWGKDPNRKPRSLDSIYLKTNQLDEIVDDVTDFLTQETKDWYEDHGIPYRRSFLFHGPPGTGKTSTICALATEFQMNCCFLNMTDVNFSNQMLGDAFAHMPSNSMLVIEDVDSLFDENRKNLSACSLTFSGLLNALDGLMSKEGILTVMTTNKPDKLDEALLRGGRTDRRFYFGPPDKEQVGRMFESFYPDAEESVVQRFIHEVFGWRDEEKARSMATLQELFVAMRTVNGKECVKRTEMFFGERFRKEQRN